ncbi:MAG: PilZ domain-containing protein [Deltaproteobacteria bacterium]|nr:PilZ domain-containing protein [Deltaproteobacteria bacterium]
MKEKRRHLRQSVKIEARYHDIYGTIIRGEAKNISKGGVFLETEHPLDKDSILTISLDATDFGKIVDIQGKVVRVIPGEGMAIQFTNRENKDIQLLIDGIKRLNRGPMISLSRMGTKV